MDSKSGGVWGQAMAVAQSGQLGCQWLLTKAGWSGTVLWFVNPDTFLLIVLSMLITSV
jgi:hypothetical protein